MKKLLVLDNYDSFTYNLVHIIREHGGYVIDVYRNDAIDVADVASYDAVVLSPGPGIPEEAGILKPLIREYAANKRIFGVCLGMQAIGEVFGGRLTNLPQVYHGVATPMTVTDPDDPVFNGVPQQFMAGRYHSWILDERNLPDALRVTSRDEQGRIMSVRHKKYPVFGLQFHPESILTPDGKRMIFNFLNL